MNLKDLLNKRNKTDFEIKVILISDNPQLPPKNQNRQNLLQNDP
jgi:hypothetical protein